jgi:hypothetical protein
MNVKSILSGIFLFLIFCQIQAAHIVGGEVNYKCISSNSTTQKTKFHITYTIYRDGLGLGAPFDISPDFGVYKKSPNQSKWELVGSISSNPTNITDVPYEEPCVETTTLLLVEKATYEFDVELDWSDVVYQIVYQRCCRNNTISNISLPAETGAAYTVEIYPDAVKNCNNSSVFKKFPPILICANRALDFDHSTFDVEGDSVVYEFCAPLAAGGTAGSTTSGLPTDCNGVTPNPLKCLPPFEEVSFLAPFSGSNPLGGNPLIVINSKTGKITGVPRTIGQFVVGVCAKEFRKGKLLSIVRRDFQFNVTSCTGPFETINFDICANDSLSVNGVTYNGPGTYTQQLTSINGCDSTLTIEVKEVISVQKNISLEKCTNKSISYNGITYTIAGAYQQTIKSSIGCDSIINIKIIDLPIRETKLNFRLCEGETVKVNNETYSTSGNFQQLLTSAKGCDSIILINILSFPKKESNLNYKLCGGESVVVNNINYSVAGNYQQKLSTSNGCDSILLIKIEVFPISKTNLNFTICGDDVITINNTTYSASGNYQQVLKSINGCDSLLEILVIKGLDKEENLSYKICDDEVVEINGETYNSTGTYKQNLQTTFGCDSTLNISVIKNISKETVFTFSLCDGDRFVVNNQEYKIAGQFTQSLLTTGGCDSLLVINITACEKLFFYDFENCDASNASNTMIYTEFIPTYKDTLECGKITATNIFRNKPQENKHSCTPGRNGGLAMCVSSSSNCTFEAKTVTPITFEVTIDPEDMNVVKFNQLVFFQKAPKTYDWIGGNTGKNNYPTKYGVKIFKDGIEVFSAIEKPTSFDWSEEKFQFENLAPFEVNKRAIFKVELLPYCTVGNGAIVTAWDIDDVNVFISCKKTSNRIIAGKVIGFDGSFQELVIERKNGNVLSTASLDEKGSFVFKNNKQNIGYEFKVKMKDDQFDLKKNVSTFDLVKIQGHILGLDPFKKSTDYIAADINNDKKISVIDLVQLRKVILGIDIKFANNTSYQFLNNEQIKIEAKPFKIKNYIKLLPSAANNINLDFMAVKIGDVKN